VLHLLYESKFHITRLLPTVKASGASPLSSRASARILHGSRAGGCEAAEDGRGARRAPQAHRPETTEGQTQTVRSRV